MENTLTTGNTVLLIEVPEDAQGFVIDNSLEFLVYKIPNYKNWVTDDMLSNPVKLDRFLEAKQEGGAWLMTGKRLGGKYNFIGTGMIADKRYAVLSQKAETPS